MPTPVKMKNARINNAPIIPQNKTLWCDSLGTLKKLKTKIKTNKLSTDNAFSIQYADWNCENFSTEVWNNMNTLNNIDNVIHTNVHIVASLLENNQTNEGIRIPKALVPYTGFEWIK